MKEKALEEVLKRLTNNPAFFMICDDLAKLDEAPYLPYEPLPEIAVSWVKGCHQNESLLGFALRTDASYAPALLNWVKQKGIDLNGSFDVLGGHSPLTYCIHHSSVSAAFMLLCLAKELEIDITHSVTLGGILVSPKEMMQARVEYADYLQDLIEPSDIVHAVSMDVDGCYLHQDTFEDGGAHLLDKNEGLVGWMHERDAILGAKPGSRVLLIGSNRQDANVESSNIISIGERRKPFRFGWFCLEVLAARTGYKFDPFTLADAYAGVEAGRGVALQRSRLFFDKEQKTKLPALFDGSKISLIITQAQRLKKRFPDREVVLDFVDDRMDILEGLQAFFSKRKELLPAGLSLNLQRYFGETVLACKPPVQGIGSVDGDYERSLRYFAELFTRESYKHAEFADEANRAQLSRAKVESLDCLTSPASGAEALAAFKPVPVISEEEVSFARPAPLSLDSGLLIHLMWGSGRCSPQTPPSPGVLAHDTGSPPALVVGAGSGAIDGMSMK